MGRGCLPLSPRARRAWQLPPSRSVRQSGCSSSAFGAARRPGVSRDSRAGASVVLGGRGPGRGHGGLCTGTIESAQPPQASKWRLQAQGAQAIPLKPYLQSG